MHLKSMRDGTSLRTVDGYFARAVLPLRLSREDAERAFAGPLKDGLAEAGLGRLVAFEITHDDEDEPHHQE